MMSSRPCNLPLIEVICAPDGRIRMVVAVVVLWKLMCYWQGSRFHLLLSFLNENFVHTHRHLIGTVASQSGCVMSESVGVLCFFVSLQKVLLAK